MCIAWLVDYCGRGPADVSILFCGVEMTAIDAAASALGSCCSDITSALHAEGPGFKSQWAHCRPSMHLMNEYSFNTRGSNPIEPLILFCKHIQSVASWPHGVTVSTLDSESSDRGSTPREAFACVENQLACETESTFCCVLKLLMWDWLLARI